MILIDHTLWSDRKTMVLASCLEISDTYAAAHWLRLWSWSIENTPENNLAGLQDDVIARAAGWGGDPSEFVTALTRAKLLGMNRKMLVGGE